MQRWVGAVLMLLAAGPAAAAIVIDGRLDEPAWAQAQRLGQFKVTEPYTQADPDLATTVLVLSDERGLYVAFICDQPPGLERVRTIGQRDQYVPGDRVNLMLDFDGSGTTAYEFSVLLGAQVQDAVISRQVNYNYDWDGDWEYAVSEATDNWVVEYRIPWSIAPLGEAHDGKRTIGMFASRYVVKTARRYSQPANAFNRATFVTDMLKLEVDAHDHAQLDLFPYVAGSRDVLARDTDARAGLDVFWKPNGRHQFAATVNPDFGQIESDQLVVNFSAIPTFFPDKRPFFTENFDLFATDYTVLYTRRIGAAPDAGDEGASDILGALKYTGASASVQYGAIAAFEDDSSLAEGRDFYVARTRLNLGDALTVGLMGTHTERPTLDREADVGALDFGWTAAPGVRFSGQGLVSDVKATPTGTFDDFLDPVGHGLGGRVLFRYAPGGRYENAVQLNSKNPRFNINDAGYQVRPDEHYLQTNNDWFWRDWPEAGPVREQNVKTNLIFTYNDHGVRRPGYFYAVWNLLRRDTRSYGVQYQADTVGGRDDLITQGHGNVALNTNHRLDVFYNSVQTGLFRYYLQVGAGNSYYHDRGFHVFYMEPGFYPSDQFSVTSVLEFYDYADNLIWDDGATALGRFDYEQQYTSLNLNWFPAPRHEVRVKFQWVAGSGEFLDAYLPDAGGTLHSTGDQIDDFSFSTTALQCRYRYEFAPQSELFVVYSRGGNDERAEPEHHQAAALRRGLTEETDSRFLLKLRYRFSILD